MNNLYKKGLHIISDFSVSNPEILKDSSIVKRFFNNAISANGLVNVGEIYHEFENSGYTAVICLTESHISIHTWPEFNKVTFDVFLSNYLKENDIIVESIHNELIKLLGGVEINTVKLNR
ncbi:MAG: S-adenosylmethionine decarboxylase [Bacteroidota bacterium]